MAQLATKNGSSSTLSKSGYKYTNEEVETSKVKITIEIPEEIFKKEEKKAYTKLSANVKLQGFRPGKAPEKLIRAQLGAAPYEEALSSLLPAATYEVVQELSEKEKRSYIPIGEVHYDLANVQDNKSISFTATFDIFPKTKLGDFKKVKVAKESSEVTEKEIENVVDQMFKEWSDNSKKMKEDNKDKKADKPKEYNKPSDEWVKDELKIEAKTLKELRELIKTELLKSKKTQSENKYVDDMVKEAVKLSKIDLPASLVELELDQQQENYKQRLESSGMNVDDFLKEQKMTMEQLRESWRGNVTERIKIDLLLLEIARVNNVKITKEEIDNELANIKDENMKKQYNNDKGKKYIADVKIRQKAVAILKKEVEGK